MPFWNSNKKQIREFKASWGKPKKEDFNFGLIEHYFKKIGKSTDFSEQEKIIGHVTENEHDRIKAQLILSKLNTNRAFFISWLFLEDFIAPPKHLAVFKYLSIITFLSVLSSFFLPKLIIISIGLVITNMILHYANKINIYMYSDSIPQLPLLCKGAKELLKIKLPVHETAAIVSSLKSIDKIKKRLSVFTLESKQQSDVFMTLAYLLVEYVKMAFLLEPTINEMIKESRSGFKSLFLLDEIFKGTNTIERIAAGASVLSYICKNGDGGLKTRNAIRILEINGYPKEIIEEAKEISNRIIGHKLGQSN
jgi:hypothetical protein